jgi:hypothetical protein
VLADGDVPRILRENKENVPKLALKAGLLRIKLGVLIEIGIDRKGKDSAASMWRKSAYSIV